jgi:hypothetical protein
VELSKALLCTLQDVDLATTEYIVGKRRIAWDAGREGTGETSPPQELYHEPEDRFRGADGAAV